jgi:hypothetical protein
MVQELVTEEYAHMGVKLVKHSQVTEIKVAGDTKTIVAEVQLERDFFFSIFDRLSFIAINLCVFMPCFGLLVLLQKL